MPPQHILTLVACVSQVVKPAPILKPQPLSQQHFTNNSTFQCHDDNNQIGCNFNLTEVYTLAALESTVYCKDNDILNWNCSRCQNFDSVANFNLSKFIYDEHWDFKALLGFFPATNSIIVAFRGTNDRDISNWLDDFDSWLIDLPIPYNGVQDVLVHAGFCKSYFDSRLYEQVRTQVDNLLDLYGKGTNIKIIGHSMGAAFAELAALDFLLNSSVSNIDVVTFGCPRVGNKGYYQLLLDLLPKRSWRVTNKHDPVPFLPFRFLGFHHAAREAWIKNGNSLEGGFDIVLCDDSGEDPRCHDSVPFYEFVVYDHLHYFGLNLLRNYSEC